MVIQRFSLILILSAAAPAAATSLEDRLREQLQSTVTQLREIQGSQATLEAAKAAAEKERDALKAKLGSGSPTASRELAAAKSKELAAAKNQNAALAARIAAAQSELVAANGRAAELAAKLGGAQTELAQSRTTASASSAAFAGNASALQTCVDRNARLVTTGRDLVALHRKRYGHGSFPPLQLLRTRIENEAQAMGDKVNADAIVLNGAATAPK